MPLSEEELRLLEQMERALAAEDPKFVSTIQGRSSQRAARLRMILAGVVFVVGMAVLLGGAVIAMTWLGILGFIIMLASATVGLTAWRGRQAPAERSTGDPLFDFNDSGHRFSVVEGGKKSRRTRSPRGSDRPRGSRPPKPAKAPKARAPKTPKSGTFLQRMEERWQQRRNGGGF